MQTKTAEKKIALVTSAQLVIAPNNTLKWQGMALASDGSVRMGETLYADQVAARRAMTSAFPKAAFVADDGRFWREVDARRERAMTPEQRRQQAVDRMIDADEAEEYRRAGIA